MKLHNVVNTCPSCPSQWDAMTDDGHSVYIRYRWGRLSVKVCPDVGEREYTGDWTTVYNEQIGDHLDGYLSDEDMLEIVEEI